MHYFQKDKSWSGKDEIFYMDIDKGVSIKIVGDDFTQLPPNFIFNDLKGSTGSSKPSILNKSEMEEALSKLKLQMSIIEEDIKPYSNYESYIDAKYEWLNKNNKDLYEQLSKNKHMRDYYFKRNTLDDGINVPFIQDEEEFRIAKKYFGHIKGDVNYVPSVGDFINYGGEYVGKVVKISKTKVYLMNTDVSSFDRIKEISIKDFKNSVSDGVVEVISEIEFKNKISGEVVIVHSGGTENYWDVYPNKLTEDEIEHIHDNPECEDDETSRLIESLGDSLFHTWDRKSMTIFCDALDLEIIDELEHILY